MNPAAERAPSLWRLAGEATAPIEIATGRLLARAIGRRRQAERPRDVLVLPGFLKDDRATASLRAALDAAGHRAFGWEMGRNLGATADTLERLRARLDAIGTAPLALVGWSLGGLFARELAKLHPARVERVVTMGTPFSGGARANHAWRLYERIAGHPVDRPPIAVVRHEKPPVFTVALWSRRDGIVAPAASRGLAGEADVAIEVRSGHVAFAASAPAIRAVLDALAMPIPNRPLLK